MNIPNILTIVRMILIIPFVFFMYGGDNHSSMLWACLIFVVASLTDLLDGKIARKYNLVTNFGKLMDPLADKLLVMSAMIMLVDLGYVSAYVVIIILAREFLVTSVRLLALNDGVVVPADKLGKWKTAFQMTWLISQMLFSYLLNIGTVSQSVISFGLTLTGALMYISLILTVVSGINYVIKGKNFIFK